MILLLTGANETARAVVAETILDKHKDWHHLALEDLHEDEPWEEEAVGPQELFGTMVACECAKEVHDQGNNVIITCPALSLMEAVQQAFPKQVIKVHMGRAKDGQFDHVIDPKTCSATKMYAFFKKTILRRK